MVTDKEQDNAPTRLWVRVLLGVSLALNLLVLGLVGGAMYRFGGPDGMRPPSRTAGAALFRELPQADRRALWAKSNGTRTDQRARQKADASALASAVRATPFDVTALQALLEQQAARRAGFKASVQQAWLARVDGMTAKDRQAYADRLERALTHHGAAARHNRRNHD